MDRDQQERLIKAAEKAAIALDKHAQAKEKQSEIIQKIAKLLEDRLPKNQ